MHPPPVKEADLIRPLRSRREFLRDCAATASLALVAPAWAAAQDAAPLPQPGASPWWMRAYQPRSRVVEVRAPSALRGSNVDPIALRRALDRLVMSLCDAESPDRAWQAILGDARRIALKFNSVQSELVRTNDGMAEVLVEQLRSAGYPAEQISLIEVSSHVRDRHGTAVVRTAWGSSIEVGGQSEQLASYLTEADAVINVPLLKTHQIAGMSCCMSNLCYAVIRRPARYHAGRCTPFMSQIVSDKQVSGRLRLNVVNALRTIHDGGADAETSQVSSPWSLIAGFDPIAVDAVALVVLSGERRSRGLNPNLDVPYLAHGNDAGVGRCLPTQIEHFRETVAV